MEIAIFVDICRFNLLQTKPDSPTIESPGRFNLLLSSKSPEIKARCFTTKNQFSILDPIDRSIEISKYDNLIPAIFGKDIWNAYEFSYLDKDLNPHLNVLEIIIPSTSEKTVESKSMKLYLNSFYARSFINKQHILKIIEADLSNICNASVSVTFKKSFSKKNTSLVDLATNKKSRF